MGHAPWSIGAGTGETGSRSGYKHDQLSLDGAEAQGVVEEISKSDAFLGKLVGVNELGSHGAVGRWREMTMNDSLVRWGDEAETPRTEIIAHAPGQSMLSSSLLLPLLLIRFSLLPPTPRLDDPPEPLPVQRDLVYRYGRTVGFPLAQDDDEHGCRDLERRGEYQESVSFKGVAFRDSQGLLPGSLEGLHGVELTMAGDCMCLSQ
jgi:hypothetical protein